MFKSILQITFAITLVLSLAACESTSMGAISLNNEPAKIEIKENTPNGMIVEGMDITINSEFLGTARRIGNTRKAGMNSVTSFEPLQSRYGEIKISQNINGSMSGLAVSFDVFIAGKFAGNVQMSNVM